MSTSDSPNENPTADNMEQRNFDNGLCSICLGPHVNKSRPPCGHVCCFECLVDWCKIKLECPTCKQPFTSFIHSIESPQEFVTHTPEPPVESEHVRIFPDVFLLHVDTLVNSEELSDEQIIHRLFNALVDLLRSGILPF